MAQPNSDREELERLRKKKRLQELEQRLSSNANESALTARAERGNRGRTFPDWMKGAPKPLPMPQAKARAAEEIGLLDGLTFRMGDEAQGLFNKEAGRKSRDLINYAKENYADDFQRGEMQGIVGSAVATAPLAVPKAAAAISKLPLLGPKAKMALSGAMSGVGWDTIDQVGAGDGSLSERVGDIDTDRTRNAAVIGGTLGGAVGMVANPLNAKQQASSTVLDGLLGEGTVSPDDLRVLQRFLKDNGASLDSIRLRPVNELLDDGVIPRSESLSLPVRLKDVLVKEAEGLRNPIQRQLRGTSGAGDEGADIIHKAIDEDLPKAREFLKGGLKDTLGSQSRLSAMDDVQGRLSEIGKEGYQPLLGQDLPEESKAVLSDVLNGPGMNKLHEPLRTVAAGEGLDLDAMMKANPLEAAHWMQSKARQLADRSSDAVVSNAMGSLRQRLLNGLNAATDGQYDVIRRQYGDEFGNLQALEFGDRFLTKANKDLDIDLMAREFSELSPNQQEAALLSVRDAIQSSTGRGKASSGPRLTKVREEQVQTALPKVFGKDGENVSDLIQETDDFVQSRTRLDTRPGSQTAPLGEDIEFAKNTAVPPMRRKIGNLIRDAATDVGVSTAFGNAVPFRLLRSGGQSLGDFIGGDPNKKMNQLAKLLEARINPAQLPSNPQTPSTGNVPSLGNAAGVPMNAPPGSAFPQAAIEASQAAPVAQNGFFGRKPQQTQPINRAAAVRYNGRTVSGWNDHESALVELDEMFGGAKVPRDQVEFGFVGSDGQFVSRTDQGLLLDLLNNNQLTPRATQLAQRAIRNGDEFTITAEMIVEPRSRSNALPMLNNPTVGGAVAGGMAGGSMAQDLDGDGRVSMQERYAQGTLGALAGGLGGRAIGKLDDRMISQGSRQVLEGRAAPSSMGVGKSFNQGYQTISLGDASAAISRRNDYLEISNLRVPEAARGQGAASAMLDDILRKADAEGLTVHLTADPIGGGMSKAQLERFYKSRGFVPNKGRNKDFSVQSGMIREPQKVAQSDSPILTAGIGGRRRKDMLKDVMPESQGARVPGSAVPQKPAPAPTASALRDDLTTAGVVGLGIGIPSAPILYSMYEAEQYKNNQPAMSMQEFMRMLEEEQRRRGGVPPAPGLKPPLPQVAQSQ